jgi:hypothetical protein
MTIPSSIVFVIGGTDDLMLPLTKAISTLPTRPHIIQIDPALDMKPKFRKQLDEFEPTFSEHHRSHFRMIYEDKELLKKISSITHFGL